MSRPTIRLAWLVPTIYIVFLLLPIYWLLNMSFKTTNEILGGFSLIGSAEIQEADDLQLLKRARREPERGGIGFLEAFICAESFVRNSCSGIESGSATIICVSAPR